MRTLFFQIALAVLALVGFGAFFWPPILYSLWIILPLIGLGIVDVTQTKHAIRRNFPILGHGRFLFEKIRPEINQYFVESNWDGRPFNREKRSVVYQRAKKVVDSIPFGTQLDVYEPGYEWINHSLRPKEPPEVAPRIIVGGNDCTQPYAASLLNVSAMSFGSLSKNAILALNTGAKIGGFAHNTGEGGLSPHHLQPGGDLVWQIGTGYFSCRSKDGQFSPERFKENAAQPAVKMIELKLSQGAKPGHGGILPGAKVTAEIAKIRGVEEGKTVVSPPAHSSFSTPVGLLEFIQKLRVLSGGKPVGFKLCIGKRREFFAICKAMLETGILPDFITVDGSEGGTGAAPVEFSDYVGTPLDDALVLVHNALVGIGVRDKIRVIASGKIITGFSMASKIAMGADLCNSARAMMFALGCIQALRCNTNECPAGVATQDPGLTKGLYVPDKSVRVANYQSATVKSFLEVISAAGLSSPGELRPWHIQRRISDTASKHYGEIYGYIEAGALLSDRLPDHYARAWVAAQSHSFDAGGA